MLDTSIRRHIDPWLNRGAARLAATGMTANGVTWSGFALGMLAAALIAFGWLWTGAVMLLVSRICDGLDGAVARHSGGGTDLGGFLDIVLDFAFYGAIPLAFIILDPAANAVAGAVLLFTFYVNGASFLTFALMAEKQGLAEDERGSKSLLYTVGLTEATETICAFVLFCLLPGWFAVLAYIYAAMVVWTTISRFLMAYRTFG
ncbi:CDP-alcohol phosphatidyltransferase family protein [Ahrensia sp. R2A130]|uniref:CDP-alcohol phosphatidyltransferase family protein n=1 Tax=Ahrensia sp. R2A130 TaxID=744979 RepID=UPI0001E0F0C2|nr:CDP-alcohol phosphatidyltransferase family protein [Ahrensia sp. R2A130]EFL89175.1 inner membrane protein YnjF [Ahrensia sp. R2A130]